MARFLASTCLTRVGSNQCSTGVSSDALKSPCKIAAPIVAEVTDFVIDCIV